jgi:DNA repair protein RecO (recombination protein O)
MLRTVRAIVLKTVKHGDRTVILKAWTEHGGTRSYVVRTSSKKGNTAAVLQPLTRLELVADEHDERDLHNVRELRVERPFMRLHTDPLRAAVALFVQEVFYKVLRTEGEEPQLDAFVRHAIETIDTADDLRCYPLVLLIQLSGHLGFFPEYPNGTDDHFDLQEGCFFPAGARHGHTLAPPLSHAFMRLLATELDQLHTVSIPASQRRELLDHVLLYYRLHMEGLGEFRSPDVLHSALT